MTVITISFFGILNQLLSVTDVTTFILKKAKILLMPLLRVEENNTIATRHANTPCRRKRSPCFR